ncbi:folate-binding protein [Terasakiella sp. A23]|uniref:CAF17-like 4Fe-4S cluster assembly/insertion protein YgfZ n=1 Tax=Terasakiella sp. FCG-A23 TaxID=3080561 RepID=UPI002953D6EB|nr:folate-binding protein [Terasakiella sp. A23]MDV7339201.1 folate-binding protein [Terasakiella sp. A23]
MSLSTTVLPNRGVLLIEGDDRLEFLQGLISNDINKVSDKNAIYSAFLTPQGKFICDFFVIGSGDGLLIDLQDDALPAFKKKLTMFKLRANVTIKDVSDDYDVVAVFGEGSVDQDGVFADPRLKSAGYRGIIAKGTAVEGASEASFEDYDLHRIKLGLPDGNRDMTPEKSILLENGFDELNGVDWDKGCYMGQELTARTKYRALIKKRLFPVKLSGDAPQAGTDIISGEKNVGELHSSQGDYALATIKLDAVETELSANGVALEVIKPDWMVIPEPK